MGNLDLAGNTLIVEDIRVGATTSGALGTSLASTELTVLDGVTAGTVTASKAVVVDSNKDIGSFRNVTATGTASLGPIIGSVQALSGPGAVNLTTLVTTVVTTGADALTLADGAVGQVKIITMITDGGDGTLTPTNLAGGTTITFNDVGDSVILVFVDGEWQILSNNGATVA